MARLEELESRLLALEARVYDLEAQAFVDQSSRPLDKDQEIRSAWLALRQPGLDFVEMSALARRAGLDAPSWRAQAARLLASNSIVLSGENGAVLAPSIRQYGVEINGRTFHLLAFRD